MLYPFHTLPLILIDSPAKTTRVCPHTSGSNAVATIQIRTDQDLRGWGFALGLVDINLKA